MNLRPHLLTSFVLAHLVAMTITAAPLPRKLIEEPVRPRVRQAVVTWGAPLVSAGVLDDDDALVATFVRSNNAAVRTRAAALGPIWTWQDLTGTQQSWRMFGEVNPWGGWLQLHLQVADGTWSPLFIDHTEHDWMAGLLNQDRLRGVRAAYSRKHEDRHRQYSRLARWLARHAAADFPEATAFRMRYQQIHVPAAGMVREAGGLTPGKIFWEESIALEALR